MADFAPAISVTLSPLNIAKGSRTMLASGEFDARRDIPGMALGRLCANYCSYGNDGGGGSRHQFCNERTLLHSN